MKVVCKQITSEGFDLKEVTTIFSNDYDYSFGGDGLGIGKEYIVMGIAIYNDSKCLYYLIDINGLPNWYPYLLFNTSDNSVSKNWFIKINGVKEDTDIYCICGFDELCNKKGFYDQLMERDDDAMYLYFVRKIEMEKELEELEELKKLEE